MTDRKYHDIVEHNIETFIQEVVNKTLDGWAVSKTNKGDVVGLYGGTYTVSMYRDNESVLRLRNRVAEVKDAPKMLRTDTLVKAREAKAAKAAAKAT